MMSIDYKMMKWLLLPALVLLNACSDSDAPGDQDEQRVLVELRPYAPSFLEVEPIQTRAFPGDYKTDEGESYVTYSNLYDNYTPQQSLVDATIHTFFISKSDGTLEDGTFTKSGGSWRSSVKMEQNQFYVYGFIPEGVAHEGVVNTAPSSGSSYANGITFTLKKLDSVSPADVCVTVAAGRGNESGPDAGYAIGKFDFQAHAEPEKNYVYLLFDHIYSAICFSFKVNAEYNNLRTIKITKLRLLSADMKKYVDATITLTPNNTGANPVTSVVFSGTPYDDTADGLLFQADATENVAPVMLSTTATDFLGCFVPGDYNRFTLETTYDVYDKDDNLVRKNCVAENNIYMNSIVPSGTWKRGTMLKLNLTVNPTYLYMLSEPDLDNPTVELK